MKPSNNLFELIKSLSKSEKRYFKLFTSLQKGEKDHLRLFTAIEKQCKKAAGYDEKKILLQFRNETFIKHLPSEKNYLYNQILKTLRSYHHSIHSEVKDMLRNAEILYEKGFFKQSHKFLLKAKQIAEKYDMHWAMPELFQMEEKIVMQKSDMERLNSLMAEKMEAISLHQKIQKYRNISNRMVILYRLYGKARKESAVKEMEKLINSKWMRNESAAISTESKLWFHDAWIVYWNAVGNDAKASSHVEKIIEMFHKNHDKISIHFSYIAELGNLIAHFLTAKKFDKAKSYLASMQKAASSYAKTQKDKARIYYNYNYLLLEYMNTTGQFSKAIAIIPSIGNDLAKYEGNLSDLQKAVILINISHSYFGAQQYGKSIYWLNRVRNEINFNIHPVFNSFLHIFYLIVNYEAGKNDLLPYLIQSVYRFLKKKEQLYKFETVIIYFLRNELPEINTQKELILAFQKLKNKIVPLTKDPYEKNAIEHYFDYISWLESKIENRPFAEIVREKAKVA